MNYLSGLIVMAAALQGAADLLFSETFESDPFAAGRWVLSSKDKYKDQPVKVMPSTTASPEFAKDNGVQLTQEMKHYGFGSVFSSPISITDKKDLVIQYEVKLDETLNCGGAYIKLLRDTNDLSVLDNSSPYSIMFGPDKCGSTNKIHFIVQYQNPLTKEYEEKHFNESIPMRGDRSTHLYTLILYNDQDSSFEILIDNKSAKTGSLLTHMVPAINPPREINDPTDFKPSDWVDDEKILDPLASKPLDWDEEAPRKIIDSTASKPDDWDETAPLTIPDPNAIKPEDWDDEEDGEWEAPFIDNPHCIDKGCGLWSPPMINNPDYKGKWTPPLIANPLYKGPWSPKQIPNPSYFTESHPMSHLSAMTAIAVEVWTINGGIHMDNFAIGSKEEVSAFARQTFEMKKAVEKKANAKEEKSKKAAQRQQTLDSNSSLLAKIKAYGLMAVEYLQDNPLALVATIAAALIPILLLLFFGSGNTVNSNSSNNHQQQTTSSSEGEEKQQPSADDKEDDEDSKDE